MKKEGNNIPIIRIIFKTNENKYRKLIEFGNNYKCIMNRVNKKDMITFEDSKKETQ